MLLILNATNRPNNKTQIVSKFCLEYLKTKNIEVKYYTLEDIPLDTLSNTMYNKPVGQSIALSQIQDEFIIPSKSWLIIAPEYNGTFPGILKLFIDALSVRKYGETFAGRSAGLIGTASGRAGNLRGLEHMTSFLNYLKIDVFHNKLPISTIEKVLVDGNLNEETQTTLKSFLDEFIKWAE
jgi:chromate reductase, NAD(P)H dehydrogenase (quinone)